MMNFMIHAADKYKLHYNETNRLLKKRTVLMAVPLREITACVYTTGRSLKDINARPKRRALCKVPLQSNGIKEDVLIISLHFPPTLITMEVVFSMFQFVRNCCWFKVKSLEEYSILKTYS